MSRAAILFLMIVTPALAICLALLGLVTLPSNPLGWFLFLTGIVYAVGIATARAVESERPADERICYDPYARRFVPAWMCRAFSFFIRTGYAEHGIVIGRS
jgi:hypothetical protein